MPGAGDFARLDSRTGLIMDKGSAKVSEGWSPLKGMLGGNLLICKCSVEGFQEFWVLVRGDPWAAVKEPNF